MKIYVGIFGADKHNVVDTLIVNASNENEARRFLRDEISHYNYNKIVEMPSSKFKAREILGNIEIKFYES